MLTWLMVFQFYAAYAQFGCTDPVASNYDPMATANDGSCQYTSVSLSPARSWILPSELIETSGLIWWDNSLWSHNDNSVTDLFRIDTAVQLTVTPYALTSAVNVDWEEISQDSLYFYLADAGNNANGNRTNLQILRILKSSLISGVQEIDTISFAYEDQFDFTPTGANNTDFDCEAFLVAGDSIYLFTKQWASLGTAVYALPKFPGVYVAEKRAEYSVGGLITGATGIPGKQLVLLSGYSQLLQPFLFLLYDFTATDFFGANKRKVGINLPLHQVEGIASMDGIRVFISNERFQQSDQGLHELDVSVLLGPYLWAGMEENQTSTVELYPNPFEDRIMVDGCAGLFSYRILDRMGREVATGASVGVIDRVADLAKGVYYVEINTSEFRVTRRMAKL